jgi:hypothetical protein
MQPMVASALCSTPVRCRQVAVVVVDVDERGGLAAGAGTTYYLRSCYETKQSSPSMHLTHQRCAYDARHQHLQLEGHYTGVDGSPRSLSNATSDDGSPQRVIHHRCASDRLVRLGSQGVAANGFNVCAVHGPVWSVQCGVRYSTVQYSTSRFGVQLHRVRTNHIRGRTLTTGDRYRDRSAPNTSGSAERLVA